MGLTIPAAKAIEGLRLSKRPGWAISGVLYQVEGRQGPFLRVAREGRMGVTTPLAKQGGQVAMLDDCLVELMPYTALDERLLEVLGAVRASEGNVLVHGEFPKSPGQKDEQQSHLDEPAENPTPA